MALEVPAVKRVFAWLLVVAVSGAFVAPSTVAGAKSKRAQKEESEGKPSKSGDSKSTKKKG